MKPRARRARSSTPKDEKVSKKTRQVGAEPLGLSDRNTEVVGAEAAGVGANGDDDHRFSFGGIADLSIARPDAQKFDHLNVEFAVPRHRRPSKRVLFVCQHVAGIRA